ncbi:MAG: GntR family transcriptional regulator [Lentisphaeria bacterium]|nr:GntR family transcriptional regulator [Lentisphaeria bacterium]
MGRQLKYDQVRLAILNIIAQDHLKSGDRLPSVRQLLTRIPCSMITLRKSLEMLENEGMLTRCIGKGTFLRQTISSTARNGKILFINVNRKNEISYPPSGSCEYVQSYFNKRGFDFQYLQVESFSDVLLKSLDNVLGIMLYGWLAEDFLRSMKSLQMPMLIVGNSRHFPGIPQIKLDIRSGTELVTERLIQSGAKSLFLLNSGPEYYMQGDISTGVRNAIRKHDGIQFREERFSNTDTPEYMKHLIEQFGHYDAWIFEKGIYYTYLGTCRYYSLQQHRLIGIAGDYRTYEHPTRYLIISSPTTVCSYFRQSIFEVACEELKKSIVDDIEIHSVTIKSELKM